MDFLLGLGIGTDTVTDDRLDLTGGPYYVLADQFRVDEDATDPRYVLVVFGMHIKGATKAALLDARNAIVDKLNQATLGGSAVQDWVTLGVRTSASETMVWWHVVEGTISAPGEFFPAGNYIGHMGAPFQVTLRCHRGAFSEPIEDEPALITGSDPVLFRAGIPGTLPAYVEATITDTSENGVVLHGIGIGSRSAKDMADGDYEPFQIVGPDGIGTPAEDAIDVDDAFGSEYVDAVPPLTWATMCYAQPTEAQMRGRYDLWVRARDETPMLDSPPGLLATPVPGANIRQSVLASKVPGTPTKHPNTGNPIAQAMTLPGNTLFLDIWAVGDGVTPSVSSVPAGFTLVKSQTETTQHLLVASYMYANAPATNGEFEITVANELQRRVRFEEWSGLTSSPLDVTASDSESAAASHSTGTTATTAEAISIAKTMHLLGATEEGVFVIQDYPDGYTKTGSSIMHIPNPSGVGSGHRLSVSMYAPLSTTGAQEATLETSSTLDVASANLIAVYKATVGGALSANTYHYRVSSLDADGRMSRASNTVAVYHADANSATQLEWQESLSPAVVGYRVFIRQGTGSWVYFDTPDTVPAFLHTTMSGPDGTADPPDTGDTPASFRLGFGLGESGTVLHMTRPVLAKRANSIWEWVRISSEDLSVLPRPASEDQPDYRVTVQVQNPTRGANVSVNCVAFIPADEAYMDAHVDYELDAPHEWVIGTNPGGHRYAWVRDTSDATDTSGATASGTFAVGPGDTTFVFILTDRHGQSVVEDAGATVQMTLYPRHVWLAGSIS